MEAIIWIALVIVFAVAEIITVGLTSIWFAGGALAALFCYAVGWNVYVQFCAFVIVTAVLLVFTRPWALKYLKPRLTKTNYESVVGQTVCITEDVDNVKETGTAVYNGQEWRARAADAKQTYPAGAVVRVKEIRGVTMYVEGCGNEAGDGV